MKFMDKNNETIFNLGDRDYVKQWTILFLLLSPFPKRALSQLSVNQVAEMIPHFCVFQDFCS